MTALRRLLDRFPHDELHISGAVYMRRWYLAGYAPATKGPSTADTFRPQRAGWWWRWGFGAVRIHEIVADDDSRAFHDHPWDFVTIGLRGSYTELTPDGGSHYPRPADRWTRHRTYRAPWCRVLRAEQLHVLRVVRGPVWTLVLMGRKRRKWGFMAPDGWMPYNDFDARFPDRNAFTV